MALEFGRTSHGIEVFVDRMPDMHTARIALDVNVGSIHESPGEEGLAHVLEHAVHLQTADFRTKADITRYQGIHAISANAYTNYTHTEYHGTGPDVEPIVLMLGEVVTRPEFTPDGIDPEMKVVTEEVRRRCNSYELLHSLAINHTLIGGSHGRDIAGHLRHLNYATSDVQRFYAQHYVNRNMTLWGVGNVGLDSLVEYAERYFTPESMPSVPPQKGEPGPSIAADVSSGYILEKSETNYYTKAVACDMRLRRDMIDYPYAFEAAAKVLSNHALDILRNRDGIAYGAHIYPHWYGDRDAWNLRAYTTAASEHLQKVESGMAEVLSRPSDDYPKEDILSGIGASRARILTIMDNIGQRAVLQRKHLDWYDVPREVDDIAHAVRDLKVSRVRWAMDRMLEMFAENPRLTHVTGMAEAVGDVDVIIEQDDVM